MSGPTQTGRSPVRSGHQGLNPVLSEVAIEGEGVRNAHAVHDHEAGGISKGKVLVILCKDDVTGTVFILGGHSHHRDVGGGHPSEESAGSGLSQPHKE